TIGPTQAVPAPSENGVRHLFAPWKMVSDTFLKWCQTPYLRRFSWQEDAARRRLGSRGPASGRLGGDNANPDQQLGVLMVVDLVIVFGLILLNGLFAMSELAVVSARKSRLQNLARRGVR